MSGCLLGLYHSIFLIILLHISHHHFIINCQELLGGYEESEFEDFFSGLWSTFKDKYLHKQVCIDS